MRWQPPLNLEISTATRRGPGPVEHDLLANTRSNRPSRLARKLYSLELACFEVSTKCPRSFNWRDKLCDKALKNWDAEVKASPAGTWGGRLVVFVELQSPCHSRGGAFRTHGALVHPCSQTLDVLWGWDGFAATARTRAADKSQVSIPRLDFKCIFRLVA